MKKILSAVLLYIATIMPSFAINFPDTVPYNPHSLTGAFRIEVFQQQGNNAVSVYRWSFNGFESEATGVLSLEKDKRYYVRIMGNNSRGTKRYEIKKIFYTSATHSDWFEEYFLRGVFTSADDIGYFTRYVFFPYNRDRFRLSGTYADLHFSFTIPYQYKD